MRLIVTATSVEEALSILSDKKGTAKLIAGGTDVMIELRKGILRRNAETLIDISKLKELSYVREEQGMIHVGAGLSHADCMGDPVLREKAPLLPMASAWVGSPQVRNRGTIGGNLVTAAACADTVPALVAMDAEVRLVRKTDNGPTAERWVSLVDFITGVGRVVIEPDELMTEIRFPVPAGDLKADYEKLVRRNALAKSRMTVAALGSVNGDGTIKEVRLSLGSITPSPMRFTSAEDALMGKKPDEDLYRTAAEAVSKEMIAKTGVRWSTEYKKPVCEALTVRVLQRIFDKK